MNKIEFKDLPDTTTPVDASNLNLLQNNIESWLTATRTSNVDLNNYKTTGVHYFTTGCTNAPTSYFFCLVFGGSGDGYVVQIGVPIADSSSKLYIRKLNETTWSSWAEL